MGDDGYIQLRQRELNDKLTSLESRQILIDKRLENIDKTIDNYSELIDALKKQDEYNKMLQKTLQQENETNLKNYCMEIRKSVEKQINDTLQKSIEKLISTTTDAREIIGDFGREVTKVQNDFNNLIAVFTTLCGTLIQHKVITVQEAEAMIQDAMNLRKTAREQIDKHKKLLDKVMKKIKF